MGQLAQLEHLQLDRNTHLSGTIPTELYSLSNLTRFELWGTNVTGSLSPLLGQWTQLTYLALGNPIHHLGPNDYGHFTGTIPTTIGRLSALQSLILNRNQFPGTLPVQIGQLPSIVEIELVDNQFRGSIPDEFFRNNLPWLANNLKDLLLQDNALTNTVPAEIWSLSSLQFLNLTNNKLVGQIPGTEIGRFTELLNLDLANNLFQGSIPLDESGLGNCTSLMRLELSGNNFSGVISSQIGLLSRLDRLNLGHNALLSGTIPSEISGCAWYVRLLY